MSTPLRDLHRLDRLRVRPADHFTIVMGELAWSTTGRDSTLGERGL